MSRLTLRRAAPAVSEVEFDQQPTPPGTESECRPIAAATPLPRLLVSIEQLAELLARSVPSLHRDDAAGRLPAALKIGGSKRWRYAEIAAWVEAGMPDRQTWNVMNGSGK